MKVLIEKEAPPSFLRLLPGCCFPDAAYAKAQKQLSDIDAVLFCVPLCVDGVPSHVQEFWRKPNNIVGIGTSAFNCKLFLITVLLKEGKILYTLRCTNAGASGEIGTLPFGRLVRWIGHFYYFPARQGKSGPVSWRNRRAGYRKHCPALWGSVRIESSNKL